MDKAELLRLARVGAQARLATLQQEMTDLLRQFPELRRGRPGRPASTGASEAAAPAKRRRKNTMTAEQRKAVSERMKKYWASRRTAKKKDAKG